MVVEKHGFRPWKRESLAAVGVGEREGAIVGEREKKRKELKVWEREREREREREEKGLGLRWGEEKGLG